MADAKPTISQAKSVGDWVKAYLDDDANEMSKRDKFLHLQRVTQFGAFCYMIQNNSKQAHIDFFDSNYTHMDTDVAKAAEMVSRLIEIKYTNYPTPLSNSDVDAVNRVVGLFGGGRQPLTDVIREDYIKLAESFSEHIPQYPNPSDTANMMKALNKDMVDVQSDHTRLVHATASDKGALKRDDIYAIMDVATEKLAGIWKEAKDEKSAAEKALMKDSEDAVGKRIDLGIKTAKVGILGAGAVGCIGAVVGGLFWPALGLIPIFVLGKRWLPDFAKSIGGLYGNFKKRVADRYKIKKAQIKQDYIEKGPNALTKAQLMMLSPGDRIILDKQRKSFPYLYGKDSLREMTMDYLNLGKLESPTEVENMVPADVRDMLNGKINAFGATTTYNDLMQTANMIKSFESKLPEMDKLQIKQKYAENAAEVIKRLVFNEKIGPINSYQTSVQNYLLGENSEIKKLIETNPNIARNVSNYYAFADKEHVGMTDDTDQTLEEYVRNIVPYSAVIPSNTSLTNQTGNGPILDMVRGLQRRWGTNNSTFKNAEYVFIDSVTKTEYSLDDIKAKIRGISESDDKEKIEKALTSQMRQLFESDKKDYTIKAMEILRGSGTDGAKNDLVGLFKEIGELKFEDLTGGKAGELYQKILKTNPRSESQPMDLYLLTRFRLAMQELCMRKLDTLSAGTPEIKDIKEFMLTVTNSPYVDEYHKQEVMDKAVNRLFKAYINNHREEFKTNLSKTAEFMKSISELNMLSDNQRKDIIQDIIQFLDPAILSNVNDLKLTFASNYTSKTYTDLLEKESMNGGLNDLFKNSTDPSILAARDKIEYLSKLGSIKIGLDVGAGLVEQKVWNDDELRFVTQSFFTDKDGKFKMRSSTDSLYSFIGTTVKNISNNFKSTGSTKIDAASINTSDSYKQLTSALAVVESMRTGAADENQLRDGFAALLLLKNKCVSLFRDCVKQFIQQQVTDSTYRTEADWISQTANLAEVQTLIANWGTLMGNIDNEISNYPTKLQDYCMSGALKELSAYTSGVDVLKSYQDTNLVRGM